MTKILILQGGFNEEHKVSLNTSKEIAKAFKKLKIKFKTLTVNPITFEDDILEYSNDYVCFNALHGTFGEDGKIQKILKKNKFKVTHSNQSSSSNCFNKIKKAQELRDQGMDAHKAGDHAKSEKLLNLAVGILFLFINILENSLLDSS